MPRKKKIKAEEGFNPDWCTPPGGTIQDVLEERGMTHVEFADRMAMKLEQVAPLLDGTTPLTLDIVQRLMVAIGYYNTAFWLKREEQYRDGLAKGKKKVL